MVQSIDKIHNDHETNQSDLETMGKQRKSLAGCLKGTFVLPLPDEPLEDFAEYM